MIPLGVVWIGYTLVWYGFCLIKGPGLGLTDLIKPSGVAKVDGFLAGGGAVGSPGNPATGNASGLGTINNPPGLPPNPSSNPGGPRAPDGTPLTPPNALIA